jgi:hypothetical protein
MLQPNLRVEKLILYANELVGNFAFNLLSRGQIVKQNFHQIMAVLAFISAC